MIWLVPAAWFGALAVAAPIVVHLLARPRAVVQPFPTLRFLPATAHSALRRHRIEEWLLLAVRCAIVVSIAAALAGPFIVTRARRAGWNARVVRETVDDSRGPIRVELRRAVAALETAPPGRREVVVRSAFPIGSIDAADVAAVPAAIGLRFERTGTLPSSREIDGQTVMSVHPELVEGGSTSSPRAAWLHRRILLDGVRTSVADTASGPAPAGALDIVGPPAARSMFGAVLAERVLTPASGRRARLVIAPASTSVAREAVSVRTPWIADAIARIGRDEDLRSTMRQASSVLGDALFAREPWHAVALNRDAQPAAAASADASGRLVVAAATAADDLATAVLTRAILNAVSDTEPPVDAEIVSISDAQLRAWTRQAGDAGEPGRDTMDEDDRRVLWTAVLLLIGVESWIRRRGR